MEDIYEIKWRKHSTEAFEAFNRFRTENKFTDVLLFCNDGIVFKAHRCVLSACCSYFEKFFTGESGDETVTAGGETVVNVSDFGSYLVKMVLDFIYGGIIDVPGDVLNDFMNLAEKFEIRGLSSLGEEDTGTIISVQSPISTINHFRLY
jgi:hypothetical protein